MTVFQTLSLFIIDPKDDGSDGYRQVSPFLSGGVTLWSACW